MEYTPYQPSSLQNVASMDPSVETTGPASSSTDLPPKYTPVAGRLSRARKGVPIHTCCICHPVKAFARAEHLRSRAQSIHQLSHQKPAYPCTFEDCERAFLRPDLLARHMHRHETQGEKAYRADDHRGLASLSTSESGVPSFLKQRESFPKQREIRSSASNFQGTKNLKRTADEAQLPGSSCDIAREVDWTATLLPGLSIPGGREAEYATTPQLPLLRIPEGNWYPEPYYSNSPWCSPSSSSTYTRSDSSSQAPSLSYSRSRSLSTVPSDWTASSAAPYWSEEFNIYIGHETKDLGSYEMLEAYEMALPWPRTMYQIPTSAEGLLKIQTTTDHHSQEPPDQLHGRVVDDLVSSRTLQDSQRIELALNDSPPHLDQLTGPETIVKIEDPDEPSTGASVANIEDRSKLIIEAIKNVKYVPVLPVEGPVSQHVQDCETAQTSDCGSKRPDSVVSISSDPSRGFETDSSVSGEETDWDGYEGNNRPDTIKKMESLCDHVQAALVRKEPKPQNLFLTPMKRALVDQLMQEFWTIFNHEWSENVRKCAGDSATPKSAAAAASYSSIVNPSQNKSQKRRTDDSKDASEDGNGDPKRQRTGDPESKELGNSLQFACPYHKHDPRKYNYLARNWRCCASTPFSSVARVKGHLYRRHRIFQCERCSETFKDDSELKSHFMAVKTCDLKPPVILDGITCKLEKQLRSRKKAHNDQSQEDRWKAIYQVLFPLEIGPSPYFEPIHQMVTASPSATELLEYEEFSRRELPRIFQSALESAIDQEAEPIAERLRNQLISMIQDCQAQVFSTYQSQNLNYAAPVVSAEVASESQASLPITEGQGINVTHTASLSLDRLEAFFQEPPHQDDFSMRALELDYTQNQNTSEDHERSDSGYASNPSGHQVYKSSSAGNEVLGDPIGPSFLKPQGHLDDGMDFGNLDFSNLNEFWAGFP